MRDHDDFLLSWLVVNFKRSQLLAWIWGIELSSASMDVLPKIAALDEFFDFPLQLVESYLL